MPHSLEGELYSAPLVAESSHLFIIVGLNHSGGNPQTPSEGSSHYRFVVKFARLHRFCLLENSILGPYKHVFLVFGDTHRAETRAVHEKFSNEPADGFTA